DSEVAMALIESIDENGFLQSELSDIQESFVNEYPELELDEIEAVLHRIQHFDPIGVGARDLQECLMLQLYAKEPQTPYLKLAKQLVTQYLPLLGKKDYQTLR